MVSRDITRIQNWCYIIHKTELLERKMSYETD